MVLSWPGHTPRAIPRSRNGRLVVYRDIRCVSSLTSTFCCVLIRSSWISRGSLHRHCVSAVSVCYCPLVVLALPSLSKAISTISKELLFSNHSTGATILTVSSLRLDTRRVDTAVRVRPGAIPSWPRRPYSGSLTPVRKLPDGRVAVRANTFWMPRSWQLTKPGKGTPEEPGMQTE
jgi:hypothetical protein